MSSQARANPAVPPVDQTSGYLGDVAYTGDEIDLLDLIKVLWRARRLIVGLTLAAALIAFGFTMAQERLYESRAVFVAQTQQPAVGITQPRNTYTVATLASILRSRQLAEVVVDELGLTTRWNESDRSEAIRKLQERVSVSTSDRDGIITVTFRDPDPVLARDVVAAFVNRFEDMANTLNVTEADQVVAFARERLAEVEAQLAAAEADLLSFKERYGIYDFNQQRAALVAAHAALSERIRTLTVELTGKRTYLTDRDPEVRDLLGRIAELERQRRALETGGTAGDGVLSSLDSSIGELSGLGTSQFAFGLDQVPALSVELERLEREVSLHREMYELLRQQYEAARLEASRKLNIVRLIDPPLVPDRPVSRRLVLNVALAAFVGAFLAIVLAFVVEFLRQRALDEQAVAELPFLGLFRDKRSTAAPLHEAVNQR